MPQLNPWIPILRNLKLNQSESAVVDRFESSPDGRSFFGVAEVLRHHNLRDESLELLLQGVAKHPRYTAARVILARELFFRGIPDQAWDVFEQTVDSLKENVLAQKLMLKIAIVLGKEFEAREVLAHLTRRQMIDAEIEPLTDALKVTDFRRCRENLIQQLVNEGVPLPVGGAKSDQTDSEPSPLVNLKNYEMAAEDRRDYDAAYLDSLKGYYAVPLKDISKMSLDTGKVGSQGSGVGLDSTTLAEVYENQGYFKKSLEIYQRLLENSPQSEFLRQKVALVSKYVENDSFELDDFKTDEQAAKKLVVVEEIDRKIEMLNKLLRALD